MVIDVRPILHTPGKRLDFRFELDLSGLEFDGRRPVSRPVAVEYGSYINYHKLPRNDTLRIIKDGPANVKQFFRFLPSFLFGVDSII